MRCWYSEAVERFTPCAPNGAGAFLVGEASFPLGSFVDLGEFSRRCAPLKVGNRFAGNVAAPADIDDGQPAFAPPAPRRYWLDAEGREPRVEGNKVARGVSV